MSVESSSLTIDAGQTGIRARLHTGTGAAVPFEFGGIRTDSALIPQLGEVVATVAAQTHQPITSVSAGISGFSKAETDPRELLASGTAHGVREVYLAHDSVTSYLGALGDEPGVVVAAGTGVVTLAVGAHDVARIDGWGNLIGDAGSGYWLGRAALDAVMRAYDGRGPATALTAAVRLDFPDLEMAYLDLQGDPLRVSRIAGYARQVTDLAATDAVAAGSATAPRPSWCSRPPPGSAGWARTPAPRPWSAESAGCSARRRSRPGSSRGCGSCGRPWTSAPPSRTPSTVRSTWPGSRRPAPCATASPVLWPDRRRSAPPASPDAAG